MNSIDPEGFRADLFAFFAEHQRPLPWRRDRHPYRVLVSEVMLQQTRVRSVIPYFERWMARFPDVATLAAAGEQEILTYWQGLGYYARARNLHRAAREIVESHGGVVPSDPDVLRRLPGVGMYTAGAVASIAFGVPVPAIDGNARRVLSRLMDHSDPSFATLRGWALHLIDPAVPGDFNQALMELGSLICTPSNPRCDRCPVENSCVARRSGTQEARPRRRVRRATPTVERVLAIFLWESQEGRRVLLRRRAPTGLLGGLWEFPGAEVNLGQAPENAATDVSQTLARVNRVGGALVHAGRADVSRLPCLDHIFTHMTVRYIPFVFSGGPGGPAPEPCEDTRWVDRAGAAELPISTVQLKLLDQVLGSSS